jgi:predicted metal-dependent enzyme (double-stranded beta helix superfamily)
MFDLERFIEECREAVAEGPRAAREAMARAVSDPGAVLASLGEPERAGVVPLYRAPDLTLLNVVWGPYMTVPPHNHEMWAAIGVYTGREDNIFWRRIAEEGAAQIEAAGAESLSPGDVAPLGHDIIHSVVNPVPRLTAALHIYGGDFFDMERLEWDPEEHRARPFDVARNRAIFEASNAQLEAAD